MKKTIIFGALLVFAFSACKKDRTCTCTTGNSRQVITYTKVSKSQAKANCISTSRTYGTVTSETTCNLD